MDLTFLDKKIFHSVRKLQFRIAKALQENKFNKVRKLCRILTNSYYAKLVAIFKVVTNKGKKTAGVDKVIWTKDDIFSKALTLKRRGYKPLPLKRIYILKKNNKQRPLGIPTMKDRAILRLRSVTASITSTGIRTYCRILWRP